MTRNWSVNGDQARVLRSPEMSMRGDVSPRGDKVFVGDCQEITASFDRGEADAPKAFSVSLDHVPTKVQPRSGIKVTDGGTSRLATVNEVHDATHVWTRTQIWLMASQDDISQEFLVI
jgi:hypothetical protein